MRKLPMIAAVAAMTAASVAPAAADAHGRRNGHYKQQRHAQQYNQGYYDDGYQNDRYYGQSRQRCRSGTTGAILGAAAGALLGREVMGRRSRTTGTIIGAAGGGLAGRALTRDKYCR